MIKDEGPTRHRLESWRQEFENKGWSTGLQADGVGPPTVYAESGTYRLSLCYRDADRGQDLFKLSKARADNEPTVIFVWDIPDPLEAGELLSKFGVPANWAREEFEQLRAEMPVVYARGC